MAVYVKDSIVRPFLGDTLAVIWLFYTLKSVINLSDYVLSASALGLSYGIEFAQYINIVSLLGLENIKVVKIVLGSTFDLNDIVAYTIGWAIILSIIVLTDLKRQKG